MRRETPGAEEGMCSDVPRTVGLELGLPKVHRYCGRRYEGNVTL